MSNKKYNPDELTDTQGPMNSVAKDDAKVWANAKTGVDYDEKQIKRIEIAKKNKAKRSTKKHDRRLSRQIINNINKS